MKPKVNPERRWRIGLILIFGVAMVWRWAYLARVATTPFAESLNADARIYWEWSGTILRHGPLPPAPFYLAPLYPYVLAAWRGLGGGILSSVLNLQAILGAAAVVLLADAAARLAGRRAALVVGILLALFQTTTFFDGLILPESLLFFVESLLVWFVVRADWSRAGMIRFAVYGLLVGVIALGRASHAVLLLPGLWLAGARRVRAIAIALAAFVVCVLPVMLMNHHASGELIPFTYNLGYNLYVGNNPEADGRYVDITGGSIPVPLPGTSPVTGGSLDGRAFLLASEGMTLSPAASSAHWARKASAFLSAEPARAVGLAVRKLGLIWTRREIPQIETMESFARAAGPLGLPVVGTFGFMAILGLSGVVWTVGRDATFRWLVGYVVLMSLAMVPFFVTDRYRHHLIPALAVLAGVSLAGIAQVFRDRTASGVWRAMLSVGIAAAIVFAPAGSRDHVPRNWTFSVDQAIRLSDRGDYDQAARAFANAERSLGPVRAEDIPTNDRVNLAAFYFRYAIALEALGRSGEAIERWEQAVTLNPNDAESWSRLSVAYGIAGRPADATRARQRLDAVPGGRGYGLLNDAWSAAGRGDLRGGESLFLRAVEASPNLTLAWEGVIRVRLQERRWLEAGQALDSARAAGIDRVAADIYECYFALQRGDRLRARKLLAEIADSPRPGDAFQASLLDDARRRLGVEVLRKSDGK